MSRVFAATCEYPTVDAARRSLRVYAPLLRATLWDSDKDPRVLIVHTEEDITDQQVFAIDIALQSAGTGPLHEITPKGGQ
jgi:hypothetical protein